MLFAVGFSMTSFAESQVVCGDVRSVIGINNQLSALLKQGYNSPSEPAVAANANGYEKAAVCVTVSKDNLINVIDIQILCSNIQSVSDLNKQLTILNGQGFTGVSKPAVGFNGNGYQPASVCVVAQKRKL